jgi:hypothetical protein
MDLKQFIHNINDELGNSSLNKQRKRYLESHLEELLEYQKNNPNNTLIPNALELFCDLNPNALECRIYDD